MTRIAKKAQALLEELCQRQYGKFDADKADCVRKVGDQSELSV